MLRPAILLLVVCLGACHDATDHEKQRVVGRIDPSNTVTPVIVVVHTLGSPGCTTPDGQEVEEDGELVRIVPYDIIPMPGHSDVCPGDYAFYEHRIRVVPRGERLLIRAVGLSIGTRESRLDSAQVEVAVR